MPPSALCNQSLTNIHASFHGMFLIFTRSFTSNQKYATKEHFLSIIFFNGKHSSLHFSPLLQSSCVNSTLIVHRELLGWCRGCSKLAQQSPHMSMCHVFSNIHEGIFQKRHSHILFSTKGLTSSGLSNLHLCTYSWDKTKCNQAIALCYFCWMKYWNGTCIIPKPVTTA